MKKGNLQDRKRQSAEWKNGNQENGEKKSERWEKNRKKNRQNAESGARKKMNVDERQRPALFASYHNTNLSQAIAIYNTDLSR